MKLVVFSKPESIDLEHLHVNKLFNLGMDEFVLRKPTWTDKDIKEFLEMIEEEFHDQIYVCDRVDVLIDMNVKGIHFSNAFYDGFSQQEKEDMHSKLNEEERKCSISAHSSGEWELRSGKFDQIYLCPIFESISKPGYIGSWDHNWIKDQIQVENSKTKESLIALGGISSNRISEVEEMGFDGIGVLGAIWNNTEKTVDNFLSLKSKIKKQYSNILESN